MSSLLSRFKWGLSAEVHQPDYDTRISILKKIYCIEMVSKFGGIIEYVARNIKSNVRELEGAIISLIAQSSFNKRKLR
jgi:chromosomal replication initiator protein